MKNQSSVVVSGIGITTAVGGNVSAFQKALMAGEHNFAEMEREGRQKDSHFVGAEIPSFTTSSRLPRKLSSNISFTSAVAHSTLEEAWNDANLTGIDERRIGLIVGGSNIQQRELVLKYQQYRDREHFMSPSYGLKYLDSDICGVCTSLFGVKGLAHTVGGASASGQLAIIEAAEAITSGRVDVCIAVGSLMDLSYWECIGFVSLGAMATLDENQDSNELYRPFDQKRKGFVYGEACAALVLERSDLRADIHRYARLSGWSIEMDGERNSNPSVKGEMSVMQSAMSNAGLQAHQIDYVNPHGSGSILGDQTELLALAECGLRGAYINSTKSITGHGLTAAGAVEAVATLIQMKERALHPSRNLTNPIDPNFNWVTEAKQDVDLNHCLNISIGFGGINTAVCFSGC